MGADVDIQGPALAMLEIGDLPAGFAALDALAKEAPVVVDRRRHDPAAATTSSPSRARSSRSSCRSRARPRAPAARSSTPCCSPTPSRASCPRSATARAAASRQPPGDALGVLQTATSPTLLRAVDAALKGAQVELVELRVAEGLGGRGLATLWGSQHDVEAALELADGGVRAGPREGCSDGGRSPTPTARSRARCARGTRFFKEFRG